MKKIILLILIISYSFQIHAQSPIIDLIAWRGKVIPDMYLKDTNNILNPFEGTWLYTNGNTSLKIVLVKKTIIFTGSYYQDYIIGEYQYIENGVEKFNSLNDLNTIFPDDSYHKIYGNHISRLPTPFDEEITGEIRLNLMFEDNIGGDILIRKKMVGAQQAIQILRRGAQGGVLLYNETPLTPIVPCGEILTLIKQ